MASSEDETGNSSDEYHEDSLPDLVLDLGTSSYNNTNTNHSSQRSISSSLDLLNEIENSSSSRKISESSLLGEITRGASAIGLCNNNNNDWSYEHEYGQSSQEIVTEMSTSSRGVFKISYTDHSKAYVPRVSANEKYRSYLSLMPEDVQDDSAEDLHKEEVSKKILSDFRALSFEEQQMQRLAWAKELEETENEIQAIKERLAFKTAWCGVLRRNLGISNWSRKLSLNLESWSDNFQSALEATEQKLMSSESLQKAKESFEILANEVKERMRQGKVEIAKKLKQRQENESILENREELQ